MKLVATISRLNQSAVLWSWVFNFFRLASGVLLLPLLLHKLSEPDLGMYYVFLGLVTLVPMLDHAFSFNIARFAGYALGGARELQPQGMADGEADAKPNYLLIWELLLTTRALYFRISVGLMVVLAGIGWLIVRGRVGETSDVTMTWVAGGATVLAAGAEIYSAWWNSFLRGLDQVRDAARIATVAYGAKLLMSCGLLLAGLGLCSVPAAAVLAALIQRTFSRRRCLELLPAAARPEGAVRYSELLRKIWPNSWRVGLQLISGYLAFNGASVLCLTFIGLSASAQLGLTWQILMMAQGVAAVWTQVAWPRVAQFRVQGDSEAIKTLMRPRLIKQLLSYVVLAVPFVAIGQSAVDLLGSEKQLLPFVWLAVMSANVFLEMHFSFWTALLATENHVPSLWSTVVTNLCGVGLAAVLLFVTTLGVGALVIGPLVAGSLFNYWYWPARGARNIRSTWLGMMFAGR